MFLFWNRFSRASCYDRYCFYCGGFLTSSSIPFYRESSFRFRIIYFVLTFCGCCMIVSFHLYILLGILILMHLSMLYLNLLSIVFYNFKRSNYMMKLASLVCKKSINNSLPSRYVRTSYSVRSLGSNRELIKPYTYMCIHSYSNKHSVYLKPFKNHLPLKPTEVIKVLPTPSKLIPALFRSIKVEIKRVNEPILWTGLCLVDQWIILDSLTEIQLSIRLTILEKNKNSVIQVMPSGDLACRELFHYVFTYLYAKYPKEYFVYQVDTFYLIICYLTKRCYWIDLATHDARDLCRILGECVVTDFSILKKVKGKYYLVASSSLFSINWKVSDRIGYDMVNLHGNAPGWQEGQRLFRKYVSYLDEIDSKVIRKREGLFVVNTPTLYLPAHTTRTPLASEIGVVEGYKLKNLYLRREFQTFHVLPVSGLIVFGVRTFTQSLDTLSYSDLVDLQWRVSKWDSGLAKYHEREKWLPIIDKAIYYIECYTEIYYFGVFTFLILFIINLPIQLWFFFLLFMSILFLDKL